MILKILLSLFLSWESCTASVFGYPGDRHAGGEALCLGREITDEDVGIAHRSLPCGTEVMLHNPRTGRTVTAKVVDRGPYGAIHAGKWVLKRRERDPGIWRGCVDLTPRAARRLGHNGLEMVVVVPAMQPEPEGRR